MLCEDSDTKTPGLSPFSQLQKQYHCLFFFFFYYYSSSHWRAICQGKKLVLRLVHQVNGNHRAPLPSIIHPVSSPKAIMPCFNYLCTENVSLYYQYVWTCFWSLIRLCGFNGLLLMSKRWAQLKIFPTCKTKENFIKKTVLYIKPYLTLLSTCNTELL